MPRKGTKSFMFYPNETTSEILATTPRGLRSALINQAVEKMLTDAQSDWYPRAKNAEEYRDNMLVYGSSEVPEAMKAAIATADGELNIFGSEN
jgi:hypothetical protein